MLPYKYNVISPYLRDKTRLLLLHSGSQFGMTEVHDEHIMERLDKFVTSIGESKAFDQHLRHTTRDFPDSNRPKQESDFILSDIALKDTFRQHKAINERYRRKLINPENLMPLFDGATRYHISISRGYERELVNHIYLMDSEFINRKNIRPIII